MNISLMQLLGLILGLEAAVFISKANLGLSPESIAGLSGTYYDANPNLLSSLAAQNADNWIGIILLTMSVALQAATAFIPQPLPLQQISIMETILAIFIAALVFLVSLRASSLRAKSLSEKAMAIINRRLQPKLK